MLQQLQYSGVVEMVRIRRAGYPGRFTYAAFAARFGALCYRDEMVPAPTRARARDRDRARALTLALTWSLTPTPTRR